MCPTMKPLILFPMTTTNISSSNNNSHRSFIKHKLTIKLIQCKSSSISKFTTIILHSSNNISFRNNKSFRVR